jgi:hypothetical protein
MSRRAKQENEAIAERAQQILAEKAQRRRRPKAAAGADAGQAAADKPKRAKQERPPKERKPRVHQDLLTVAFRGPLAGHFRELAERHQMSLSALLQDAMLSWETNVAAGYQPGTALTEWKAQQGHQGDASE